MQLITRVTDILLKPKQTWPVIARESADVASIYTQYVMILAAIPALVSLLAVLFGLPFMWVLTGVVLRYVMALAGVYIMALIIDALAPTFGGSKNPISALKLSAYSTTAAFVGSVFGVVPVLGALVVLAAAGYVVYLMYLGMPVLMKCPQAKALPYTAVVVVLGILVMAVLGAVFGRTVGAPGLAV